LDCWCFIITILLEMLLLGVCLVVCVQLLLQKYFLCAKQYRLLTHRILVSKKPHLLVLESLVAIKIL